MLPILGIEPSIFLGRLDKSTKVNGPLMNCFDPEFSFLIADDFHFLDLLFHFFYDSHRSTEFFLELSFDTLWLLGIFQIMLEFRRLFVPF